MSTENTWFLIGSIWSILCVTIGFFTGRYVADLLKRIGDLTCKMPDNMFRWKYEDKLREKSPPQILEREAHGDDVDQKVEP